MKRTISLILAAALALSLSVSALADAPAETAEDMEQALSGITLRVKDILQVDDDYTDFDGDYYDGLRPGWSLEWSDSTRRLSVTCTEDGLITDAYRWTVTDSGDLFYGFDAAFPALAREDARNAAETWLERLMGEGESARIEDCGVSLDADASYSFTGRILENGLESPVTFTVRVDGQGLAGYTRSDGYSGYVGGVPGAEASIAAEDAGKALAASVEMELYYVADGDEARLRYVPVGAYTIVDALSGEATDMDALYASFGAPGGYGVYADESAAAPMEARGSDGGVQLTEAELSSIENYGDVLSADDLDAALRAVTRLGLDDFTLSRCSYSMDSEGNIAASLRYTAEMTEDRLFGFSRDDYEDYISWGDTPMVYKYVTVDAKTAEMTEVSTVYPLWRETPPAGDTAETAAGEFLQQCAPAMYEASALCTLSGYGEGDELTYARVQNGYFFPENYLCVTVNEETGTVDDFRYVWDEDVVFADAEGIVSLAEAERAYTDALTVTLGYAAWPEDIDYGDPAAARYADWGYTYVESLRLAYYYSGTEDIAGIDALTGEALADADSVGYVYDDLDGVDQADMIQALAEAGIGFAGGSFRPDAELTQREAVTLLLQAAGCDPEGWDDDSIRSQAAYLGFIAAADWSPDSAVTRMGFIRMLLGASRYGAAAELSGIWDSVFADVEDADAGYAAIAAALGLVDAAGGSASALAKAFGLGGGAELRPDEPCTRAVAAELLYRFMAR